MNNFNSQDANANQSENFNIYLSSGYVIGYLPYKSIEDFNIKEAGKEHVEEIKEEPFFGENIREAKAVLKGMFKK